MRVRTMSKHTHVFLFRTSKTYKHNSRNPAESAVLTAGTKRTSAKGHERRERADPPAHPPACDKNKPNVGARTGVSSVHFFTACCVSTTRATRHQETSSPITHRLSTL